VAHLRKAEQLLAAKSSEGELRKSLGKVVRIVVQIAVILSALMLPAVQSTPRALAASCTLDSSNLTTNGSMAGPGHATAYGTVANGWTPFVLSPVAPAFELDLVYENANGDVPGTGSEYIWRDTDAFDAGIYQTVSGLTPGIYYRFWLGFALAAFDYNGGGNTRTNLIGRQVGIDLTGGTNASSSNVAWGNVYWDGNAALNIPDLSMIFAAQSTSATIFLRVVNTNVDHGRSKAWFDVVCMQMLDPQPSPQPSTIFLPMVISTAP
jgi:hypothetical protein